MLDKILVFSHCLNKLFDQHYFLEYFFEKLKYPVQISVVVLEQVCPNMVKSLDFRIGTLLLRVAAIEKLGYLNYTRNVPNTFFWIFITATHSSFFFYSFINHSTLTLKQTLQTLLPLFMDGFQLTRLQRHYKKIFNF